MAMRHMYRPPPGLYDGPRALWRSGAAIKANPPRGGGAKPMDLSRRGSRAAERWWGHDAQSPKERAPPPNIAKGVGLYRVSAPSMRLSFWADGVDEQQRKGVRR